MDEYIEREALIGDLTAAMDHRGMGQVIGQTLIRYVKRQPAADVAPVVHGEWILFLCSVTGDVSLYYCSSCRAGSAEKSNYCPDCGAKMDGGTT